MQLIVILAFASVLGLPADGWPHQALLTGPPAVFAIIATVTALVLVTCRTIDRAVLAALDSPGLPINRAQNLYVRGQLVLRFLALIGHVALIAGTDFTNMINRLIHPALPAVGEMAMLTPFIAWLLLSYLCIYPADRAIRISSVTDLLGLDYPVRPVWSRWQFLVFHLRYGLLMIAVPMVLIIAARDLLDLYRDRLITMTGWQFLPDAALGLTAMAVFLISPQLIRYIWRSYHMAEGSLRSRLESLAAQVHMRYRDILIWPSSSMMINAAVMGIVPSMRYIMLSDGLIETMTDSQIEAVFGHELGHIKKRHIPTFLIFTICSMGLMGMAVILARSYLPVAGWLIEAVGLGAGLPIWLLLFGMLSRRFEWEADLFAVKCLGRNVSDCSFSQCPTHGQDQTTDMPTLCLTAAETFALSLDRIASLNGVPRTARSWRHGSIFNRCRNIRILAAQPKMLARFERQLLWIRLAIVGAAIAAAALAWHVLRHYTI